MQGSSMITVDIVFLFSFRNDVTLGGGGHGGDVRKEGMSRRWTIAGPECWGGGVLTAAE